MAAGQMSAAEFAQLPDADQRTILISALQNREPAVRNLKARSVTRVYNVAYRDGKVGEVVEDICRSVCELRRKDGNHWASINWYRPRDAEDAPTVKVLTMRDAQAGTARSVAQHRQLTGVYGSITSDEDTFIRRGRFHYWFDGGFDQEHEFPIQFLLKHQDKLKIESMEAASETIRVSLTYQRPASEGTPYQNQRTLWLDPQKGFLPRRLVIRWEYDLDPPFFQETETEVKAFQKVDGIWFPTEFIERSVGRVSIEDGYAAVSETHVEHIELGTVTDEDLNIEFEKGTEVQDRLKGVLFVASDGQQEAPPKSPARHRPWSRLVLVNVALGALIGLYYVITSSVSVGRSPGTI